MSAWIRLPLAAACLALGASCGTNPDTAEVAGPQPQQVTRIKSGDMGDDDFGKIQDRYGSVNGALASEGSVDDARRLDAEYQGELANRQFAAKSYEKKAFWGTKDYEKQVYGGDLDGSRFQTVSREAGQGAREGTMMSREDSRAFATGQYETGAARETGHSAIAKPSDAESDFRRRVYKQPDIVDMNRQALTIEDTRQMLGR